MQMISDLLWAAGPGVWPTLILALAALTLSAMHAWRPRQHWLPLILGMGAATLFSGTLAFITGCSRCFTAIFQAGATHSEQMTPIALAGVTESLGNLDVAFVALTLVALLAGVGSYRARAVPAAA